MSAAAGAARGGPDRFAAVRDALASPRLPVYLFGFAVATCGILLVVYTARLTFFVDDWEVLLHRRGFDADVFLHHHAGHPSMSLVAIYKAIQATFGMDSLLPYTVVAVLIFLTGVVLLFIWVRRRVGDWLALAATLPILFLGGAFEDLLTPFQLGFFAPVACGIGALLALERHDRRGDVICCALLVFALTFQSLGLVFVAGAVVAIAWDRELWTRWWVFVIPAALYGLWYLGYHDTVSSQLTFDNIATAPGFIADGFASSLSSLLGLVTATDATLEGSLDWGRGLLALAVVAVGFRLVRGRPLSKWFWVVLAAAIVWWFLTAGNASNGRLAVSSRYQYVGAVLIVMLAAELGRGWRPSRGATAALVGVAVLIAAVGAGILHSAWRYYHASSFVVRGAYFGLEAAAPNVDPDFLLTSENSGAHFFNLIDAGSYLSAVEAFGSPAFTEDELVASSEGAHVAADSVIADADEIRLEALAGASGCRAAPGPIQLGPGTTTVVRNPGGPPAELALRRYATESFPVELGELEAGEAGSVAVPVDRASVPWELGATAGAVEVCDS